MDDLFTVDTAGDSSVRRQLSKKPTKKQGKGTLKISASEKQRRLLAQEQELASLVFEDKAQAVGDTVDAAAASSDGGGGGSDDDDEVDYEAEAEAEQAEKAEAEEAEEEAEEAPPVHEAAWVDEDDADQLINVAGVGQGLARLKKLRTSRSQRALSGAEYEAGLRKQFESVQPDVSWAALPEKRKRKRKRRKNKGGGAAGDAGDDDEGGGAGEGDEGEEGEEEEEDDDEWEGDTDAIVRSTGAIVGANRALPAESLSVRRLTDLNKHERSHSVTPCVEWHPNGKLALTAGPDKTLRLFRADGTENPKLQSVHLEKLPIHSACFTADGSQAVLCGRGKHWCVPDPTHSHALLAIRAHTLCTRAPRIRNFLHLPSGNRTAEQSIRL